MLTPIFETSILGTGLKVYEDRIEQKIWFQKTTIPIKQVASVEIGMPGIQAITIHTTDGRARMLTVRLKDKEAAYEAIRQAMSK